MAKYRVVTDKGPYIVTTEDPAVGAPQNMGKNDYNYTPLQRTANTISDTMRGIDTLGGTLGQGANEMTAHGDEMFSRAADALVDRFGQTELGRRTNPMIPAAVGTAVSMANPLNWIQPQPRPSVIGAPEVPAARASAVAAAREFKIPLSRYEQTGDPVTGWLEAGTEKTTFGSKPINASREIQTTAKDAALKKISDAMGTKRGPGDAGVAAKGGLTGRETASAGKRDVLYENVPDSVHIPLGPAVDIADTILNEQSKFLPTTRNGDVIAIARDIQNAERGISSGEGVTGGPEVKGVTTQVPDKVIPGSTRKVASSLTDERGNSLSYEEKVPGKTIPGGPEYGVKYSVGPETPSAPKSNYALLDRLRKTLNGKIAEAKEAKNFTAYRDFTRLKVGVDKSLDDFVANQTKPLESMVANEFSSAYKKARAFAGAHTNLFQGEVADAVKSANPEHIVDSIFKRNNQTAIKQFRSVVGEDGFLPAKQRFTQDLLESKNLKGELGKYEQGTLEAIYKPVELQKITKLSEAFDLLMSAEKKMGNASGTGRQILGGGSIGAAAYALGAGHPYVAAAILGIPYVVGKVLTKTANGIPVSAGFNRMTGGLSKVVASEAGRR